MDEEQRVAVAPDPFRDVAALLRAAAQWCLTAEQTADLDAILSDLEQAVRRRPADRSMLARANGDLKVLDATVAVPGLAAGPISRTQRDRIKRLLPALVPRRRRRLLRIRT